MIVSELLSGLAVKLGAAGLAKAGIGLTVAAASVTGAGAAGVLPEPAQNAVAAVVEAATPLDIPGGGGQNDKVVEGDVVEGDVVKGEIAEGDVEREAGEADAAEEKKDNFGQRVSADARDGGVDGSVISGEARQRAEQRRPATPGGRGLERAGQTKAAPHAPSWAPAGGSAAEQRKLSGTGSASTADQRPQAGSPSTADERRPADVPQGSSSAGDERKPADTPKGSASIPEEHKVSPAPQGPSAGRRP